MLGGRRVNMNGIHENNCLEKHCNISVFLKIINNCFSFLLRFKKMHVAIAMYIELTFGFKICYL